MTCAEYQEYAENTDVDFKAFSIQQVELFKNKHPEFDVSEFKKSIEDYVPPKPGSYSDNNPPFFYVVLMACDSFEDESVKKSSFNPDETLGTRIEKSLYYMFTMKKERAKAQK